MKLTFFQTLQTPSKSCFSNIGKNRIRKYAKSKEKPTFVLSLFIRSDIHMFLWCSWELVITWLRLQQCHYNNASKNPSFLYSSIKLVTSMPDFNEVVKTQVYKSTIIELGIVLIKVKQSKSMGKKNLHNKSALTQKLEMKCIS